MTGRRAFGAAVCSTCANMSVYKGRTYNAAKRSHLYLPTYLSHSDSASNHEFVSYHSQTRSDSSSDDDKLCLKYVYRVTEVKPHLCSTMEDCTSPFFFFIYCLTEMRAAFVYRSRFYLSPHLKKRKKVLRIRKKEMMNKEWRKVAKYSAIYYIKRAIFKMQFEIQTLFQASEELAFKFDLEYCKLCRTGSNFDHLFDYENNPPYCIIFRVWQISSTWISEIACDWWILKDSKAESQDSSVYLFFRCS